MTKKSWDENSPRPTKVKRRPRKNPLKEETKDLIYSSLDGLLLYHLRSYERLSRHLRYGRTLDLQFLSRSRASPILVGLFCFEGGEGKKSEKISKTSLGFNSKKRKNISHKQRQIVTVKENQDAEKESSSLDRLRKSRQYLTLCKK